MANYICRPAGFKVLDRDVVSVLVPTGETYYAGQVIMLVNLDTSLSGNLEVWEAVTPATAHLEKYAALIVNGGEFETMADGRRPEGNPDYSTFGYQAGAVAPAIIMAVGNKFEISTDAISGSAAVGKFLEPTNAVDYLTVVDTRTSGTLCAAKILALKKFRAGGNFGATFLDTAVVQVLE